MIITSENLNKIEKVVGYDCVAGVRAGFYKGNLTIVVYTRHPVTGEQFTFEQSFTEKEITYALSLSIIDEFACKAKHVFHDEFSK